MKAIFFTIFYESYDFSPLNGTTCTSIVFI